MSVKIKEFFQIFRMILKIVAMMIFLLVINLILEDGNKEFKKIKILIKKILLLNNRKKNLIRINKKNKCVNRI